MDSRSKALLSELLERNLPDHWIFTFDKEAVHCLLISPGEEKAIQRRVSVNFQGSLTLSVHCKGISITDMSKYTGSTCLLPLKEASDVQEFSASLVQIVHCVSEFEVCCGADPKEDYVNVWKSDESAFIDNNPYLECRYARTLRAKDCDRLVNKRFLKCNCCSKLHNALCKRKVSTDPKNYCYSTSNVRLSDQQKLEKLQKQQREIRLLKQALHRVGKAQGDF